MPRKSTSPWVYVGCGCLAALVLLVGGCLSLGFYGARFARNFEEELRDPVKRQERAQEILGAEELPAGFTAQMHFKVPLLLEMVALSDGESVEFDEDGHHRLRAEQLGDNAFIYLALPNWGTARRDFERLLEGDAQELEHVQIDLDFRSQEMLGRGELDIPPQHLRYAAHRGEFRDGRERSEGVYAILLIDCPGSSKVRAAFYWQRHGGAELAGGADADLSGTPYEEGLRSFMSHFQVCEG